VWTFAFRNLASRKVRTALALLGLTVAIAAMVGLFAIAAGLDAVVTDAFGRVPGLAAMQPGSPIPLFSSIPAEWEDELREVPGVRVVSAEVWQRANMVGGKMVKRQPRLLFGTNIPSRHDLERAVYRESMVRGRFLETTDAGTPHVLVSETIATEYDVDVGDTLPVNGTNLVVVGVYNAKSVLLDTVILADIGTVRRMTGFNPNAVSAYYLEPDGSVPNEELAERIERQFLGREPLAQGPRDLWGTITGWLDRSPNSIAEPPDAAVDPQLVQALEVKSASDWGEQVNEFSGDLDVFLLLLTGIGVTIAVLSIVNTMLMSVSERITEFGVLRANGWSPGDVMRLITLESAYIGLAGGVLGSLTGWAGTLVVNQVFANRLQLYAGPGLLLFALAFSTLLGVLGGLYPAWWAIRMSPMEAIRRG
jgi:putative ABC transport system permease protein